MTIDKSYTNPELRPAASKGTKIANQATLIVIVATFVTATLGAFVLRSTNSESLVLLFASTLSAALLSGLICRWFTIRWSKQITGLTKAVDALSLGHFQTDVELVSSSNEIGLLTERFSHMRAELYTQQRGLKQRARQDRLTGLFNRAYLDTQLPSLETWALVQSADLTALMIDLDNFKQWNDALGHAAGDRILQVVGEGLQEFSGETDLVVRLGGDEFVVVVPGVNLLGATNLGERLRQNIRTLLTDLAKAEFKLTREKRDDLKLPSITISVGVSAYNGTIDDLLKHADSALYEAKRQGRDQVKVYNEARAAA